MQSVVVHFHNPCYSKNHKRGGSWPRKAWAKTRSYIKNNHDKKSRWSAQAAEHLPINFRVLTSNTSNTKEERDRKKVRKKEDNKEKKEGERERKRKERNANTWPTS